MGTTHGRVEWGENEVKVEGKPEKTLGGKCEEIKRQMESKN